MSDDTGNVIEPSLIEDDAFAGIDGEAEAWRNRFKQGPSREDLSLDALERIADALGAHRPKSDLTFIRGQARFKIVCLEVFSQLTEQEPRLNAAFLLVKGVEAGYIARRHLQRAADRLTDLSAEDRAFAVGMAAGFMTEFLPRPV